LFRLSSLREKFHPPTIQEASEMHVKHPSVKLRRASSAEPMNIIEEEAAMVPSHLNTISGGYHGVSHVDIIPESEFHPHRAEMGMANQNQSATEQSSLLSRNNKNQPNKEYSSFSKDKTPGHTNESDDFVHEHPEIVEEEPYISEEHQTITDQLQEIWETVQLRSVWRPMAFVYIFNLFQVPNVAWQSYLQLGLNFPSWVLGMTVLLGSFMTFAGVMGYKYFFFRSSWRSIYVWTVMLTTFFSLLQLLLIFQINTKYLHLHNYLFSVGDDVISAYISGIQFLPLCIMYMRLCPEGAEGSSYAMLTTFGNIALVCASNLGNLLAGVWDVSNDAMRNKDVNGLWRLNLLTSCLAVIPLSLLFLLPANVEEQDQLSRSKVRSKKGGIIFLLVLFGSLTWTSMTAVSRVFANVVD
jgi:hypothetical protein